MATGKKTNDELRASKLFDVSEFTALVTGGGTGIGLSMCISLVSSPPLSACVGSGPVRSYLER